MRYDAVHASMHACVRAQAVAQLIRASQEQRREAVAALSARGSFLRSHPSSDALSWCAGWLANRTKTLIAVLAGSLDPSSVFMVSLPWYLDSNHMEG